MSGKKNFVSIDDFKKDPHNFTQKVSILFETRDEIQNLIKNIEEEYCNRFSNQNWE